MATIVPIAASIAKGVYKTTWTPFTTNVDVGQPEAAPQYPFKTVQALGTFNGSTITIQGSNDGGTTWTTLTDAQGNPLAFTAAAIEKIQEDPQLIRPAVTAGTPTSVTVVMVSQSGRN